MLQNFLKDDPKAYTERLGTNDAVSSKRSEGVRDLSLKLLSTVQSCALPKDYADQLEHITPQLERHSVLQKKLKKWQFAREFDAIGVSYGESRETATQ